MGEAFSFSGRGCGMSNPGLPENTVPELEKNPTALQSIFTAIRSQNTAIASLKTAQRVTNDSISSHNVALASHNEAIKSINAALRSVVLALAICILLFVMAMVLSVVVLMRTTPYHHDKEHQKEAIALDWAITAQEAEPIVAKAVTANHHFARRAIWLAFCTSAKADSAIALASRAAARADSAIVLTPSRCYHLLFYLI